MSLPGWAPSFCAGETGRQRRWHVISWPGPWLSSGLRGQRPRTSKFRCVVVAHMNFLCRWPTIMYLPGCSPQRKAWKNIQRCSGYEICHQAEVFFQRLIGGRLATDHDASTIVQSDQYVPTHNIHVWNVWCIYLCLPYFSSKNNQMGAFRADLAIKIRFFCITCKVTCVV